MNTFSNFSSSDPSGFGANKALQVDALPHLAALSGASPTAYFVWRQMMEAQAASKGNNESDSDEKIQVEEFTTQPQSYNDIHLSTFQFFDDEHELSAMIESSPLAELNKQDHNGNTPLLWAASEGRDDIVTLLVEQGADINCQNYDGETALYLAAARGFTHMVEFLLMNGANLNITNLDGASPLHIAAAEGHLDALRVLVQYGGQPSIVQDEVGDCVLHYAVREGRVEIVQALACEFRVDLSMKNEDLETPLELAQCLGESAIVQLLWAAQCNRSSPAMTMMSCGGADEMEDLTNEATFQWKAFPSVVGDFQQQPTSHSAAPALFALRC
jgi:ankyrin repeat protein